MALPLVEIQHIRKSYGLQVVLEDVTLLISEGDKIALIGRNGAGKTTLARILTAEEEADGGDFRFYPQTRLGVIKQHEVLPSAGTVLEYLAVKSEKPEWEIATMASRFGLKSDFLAQIPAALSGGYQMRVKIVAMLLQEPNLLLLDEPVNYLDLQTLLLLERFLQSWKGSFVVIAHDREFLERTCEKTIEIEKGKSYTFSGSVSEYLEWKREQKEFAVKTNKKLAKQIAHQQSFVDRFGAKASLASRAQSKSKHIAKLKRKIADISVDLSSARIRITCPETPQGVALSFKELVVGYSHQLIQPTTLDFMRGEKILIAGENGKGKSTLLKTIAGIHAPLHGSAKWWHRANIGYYDQFTHKQLNEEETVLSYLTRKAPSQSAGEKILMMAGNFLFSGDAVEKPIRVLSGGERARLCLAGILLEEHNVLLLDEPTNHLDVETAESLALALKEYKGTVIFISHARTFAHALAEKIYEIKGGIFRQFMGRYDDYVEELEHDSLEEQVEVKVKKVTSVNREERALVQAQIREAQRSQVKTQKRIEEAEHEKSRILEYFFNNQEDYAPEKAIRLSELNTELSALEDTWLKQEETIQRLRAE